MAKKKQEQKCECGAELPHHLAKVGLEQHVCRCTRRYRVADGKFVLDGAEENPFADPIGSPWRTDKQAAARVLLTYIEWDPQSSKTPEGRLMIEVEQLLVRLGYVRGLETTAEGRALLKDGSI